MQTKIFKNKKARWAAVIIGFEVMMLLLLKSCEHQKSVLPFDPELFFAPPSDGSLRAVALWLILVVLGLTALFVLFRVFASRGGSAFGKGVLVSLACGALLASMQVPDDVKAPKLSTIVATKPVQQEIYMDDVMFFDQGPAPAPVEPIAPVSAPNAGNTGV